MTAARSRVRRWEDYSLDGTGGGVLRNLREITDADELSRFETYAAQVRMMQLAVDPVVGSFDYSHMKEVHRRIFQDVYEWAGQTRIGPPSPKKMSKSALDVSRGPGSPPGPGERAYFYFPGDYLEENIAVEYARLSDAKLFVGVELDIFIAELAERWAEINVLHAFREGNTRSQFVFFHQLSANAGFTLDPNKFKAVTELRDEFVYARFYAHVKDASWLRSVLEMAITPLDDGRQQPLLDSDPRSPGGILRLGDVGATTVRGRFASHRRPESQTGLGRDLGQ